MKNANNIYGKACKWPTVRIIYDEMEAKYQKMVAEMREKMWTELQTNKYGFYDHSRCSLVAYLYSLNLHCSLAYTREFDLFLIFNSLLAYNTRLLTYSLTRYSLTMLA